MPNDLWVAAPGPSTSNKSSHLHHAPSPASPYTLFAAAKSAMTKAMATRVCHAMDPRRPPNLTFDPVNTDRPFIRKGKTG